MDPPWHPDNPPYPFVPGDKRPLFYNPKPNSTASKVPVWTGPWKYQDGARKRQRVEEEEVKQENSKEPKAAQDPSEKSRKKDDKNGNEELYHSYLARLNLPNHDTNTEPAHYPPSYEAFLIQDTARVHKKRQRPEADDEDFVARKVRVTQDLKRNHNSRKNRLTDRIGDGIIEWISNTFTPFLTRYGTRTLEFLSDSNLFRLPRWWLEATFGKYMQCRHTRKRLEHIRTSLHAGGVGHVRPHCKHMGAKQRAQQDRHAMLVCGGSLDVHELPGEWAGSKREEEWVQSRVEQIKRRMWGEFTEREEWRKMDARADAEERKKREGESRGRNQAEVEETAQDEEEDIEMPRRRTSSSEQRQRPKHQAYVVDDPDESRDLYEEEIDIEHVRKQRRTQEKEQSTATTRSDSSENNLFEVDIDNASESGLHTSAILDIRNSKSQRKVLRKHSDMPMTMLMQDGPMSIDDEGEGILFRDPVTQKLIDIDGESAFSCIPGSSSSSSSGYDNDSGGSNPSEDSDSSSSDSDDGLPMPWDNLRKANGGNNGDDASRPLPPPPVSTVLPPHLVPARVPKSTLLVRKHPTSATPSSTAGKSNDVASPESERPGEPSEAWKRLLGHPIRFSFKPRSSSHQTNYSTTSPKSSKQETEPGGALNGPSKPAEPSQTASSTKLMPSTSNVPIITITRPSSSSSSSSQSSQSGAGPKEPLKLGPTGFVSNRASQVKSSSAMRNEQQVEPSSQATHAELNNEAPADGLPVGAPLTSVINGRLNLFSKGFSKLTGVASQSPLRTSCHSPRGPAIPSLGNSVLGPKKPADQVSRSTQAAASERPNPPMDEDEDDFDDDDERVVCPECTFANEPGARWCSLCSAPFEELASNAPNPTSRADISQAEEYSDDEDGLVTYTHDEPSGNREPEFEMTGGAGPAGTHDDSGQPLPISREEKARLLEERKAKVLAQQNRSGYSRMRGIANRVHLPYFHDVGYTDEYRHKVEIEMEVAQSSAAKQRNNLFRTKSLRRAMLAASVREKEAKEVQFVEDMRKARAIVERNGLRFPEDMPRWQDLSKNEQKRIQRAAAALDEQTALEQEAYLAKCKKKREEYRKKGKQFPEDLPQWATTSGENRQRCREAIATLEAQDVEVENITEEDRGELLRDLASLRHDAGDAFLQCLEWDEYTDAERELIGLAISELDAQDKATRSATALTSTTPVYSTSTHNTCTAAEAPRIHYQAPYNMTANDVQRLESLRRDRAWAESQGRQIPEDLPSWRVRSPEEQNQILYDFKTLEEQEEEMQRTRR